MRGCCSRADNPDRLLTLSVGDDKQVATNRCPNSQKSLLRFGMLDIWKRQRKGIAENGRCLAETHSVLSMIGCIFAWIPFEIHLPSV